MENPQRYSMHANHDHDVDAEPDSQGDWVKYEDIKHLIQTEPSDDVRNLINDLLGAVARLRYMHRPEVFAGIDQCIVKLAVAMKFGPGF